MSSRGGGYRGRGRGGGGHNFGGGGRHHSRGGGGHHGGGSGGRGEHRPEESSGGGGRGGGRGRPPAHLKGREIGMWYATRSKDKTREKLPTVKLSTASKVKISELLKDLEAFNVKNPRKSEDSEFLQRYRQNIFANAAAFSPSASQSSGEAAMGPLAIASGKENVPTVDEALLKELERKQQSQSYQKMLTFREKLPAYKNKEEFLKVVSENQVVVISGETGCGKTTQCCQLILDEMIKAGNGSKCKIVCTQPRRISAISVAERVAEERDEKVGSKSVGYCIRLESRMPTSEYGTILFCTTGVVFQYLKEDPLLSKFSHILVDEIHERDVLSDFLLAILKDLILLRPELKVILMSATINAEHFSKYFGNCPCFNIPGFTFPVKELYLEDVLEKTRFVFESYQEREQQQQSDSRGNDRPSYGRGNDRQSYSRGRGGGGGGGGWRKGRNEDPDYEHMKQCHLRKLERERLYPTSVINQLAKPESEELNLELIEQLLRYIADTDKDNGAVLIFVPGWDQISKLDTQLKNSGQFPATKYLVIPLHSLMPTVNQREIFNRPTGGRRKIIIATNIAETSITIDDIVHVVDTGRIKITNFDLNRNIESLDTEWVSLANATQRRGRAGRVQEGICYHLYNKAREMSLDQYKKPEVLRKRLEEVVLQIKVLKLGGAESFLSRLMEPPQSKSVELAVKRLEQIHALDSEENLTPLGFHLAQLPMDPQTGKMILMAGIFGCVDPITTIAASLSFKDAFYIPLGQERNVDRVRKELSRETKSDHMVNVYAMEEYRQACANGRERDFCYRNYVSGNTIRLLINMKGQFAKYLYDMKFTSSPDCQDRSNNINANNVALVKAIICAGLYPNIAQVHMKLKKDGGYTYPKLRTPEDGKVDLHPKSVNCNLREIESPYLAYFQKMKSSSVFLYDTTMVSPFPLMFFGGDLRFRVEKTVGILSIDRNADVRITRDTFELIQSLRKHLDMLLEEKVNNPGPTCWNALSKDGAMLRAISELITAEYRELLGEEGSSSDSD